ncbi:4-hydroxy-tetrahydrodipicolinate reductase [Chlamydiifrater phoenicopteri]|uniref:4-hydroxy-tetrahydrodipicolinate reductase n=1 Tax=Chlamydiifrater phoenicopteri TaxID=2681469 RepID=UPI001BD0F72F|nr:dihydrodipicolinate reductase C-terminal domain-containing protein [Chlamydiifrater phoenicopteri]
MILNRRSLLRLEVKVVGVIGVTGRAGSCVACHVRKSLQFHLGKGVGRKKETPFPLGSLEEVIAESDFLIDFSSPELVHELLEKLKDRPKPIAICTTNLDLYEGRIAELIDLLSKKTLVVIAPNVSFGACVQSFLVSLLARVLDDEYDIHIHDEHHRSKKDAISGTSRALVDTIVRIKKDFWNADYSYGLPKEGGRIDNFVELSSSRSGGIFSNHEVSFTSSRESLSVVHKVCDKEAFAYGVEKILEWMNKNLGKVGTYGMTDVFGLKKRFFNMK